MPKKLRPFGENPNWEGLYGHDLDHIISLLERLNDQECENYDCTKDPKRSARSKRVELVEAALQKLREASEL